MFELFQKISSIPCVNGSEYLLAEFIENFFEDKDFYVTKDRQSNVIVQRQKTSEPPECVFFTPMDSPGYICLYQENDRSYLTPTAGSVKDLKDIEFVLDYDGHSYSPIESEYDKNAFCIESKTVGLGNPFSISSSVVEQGDQLIGRFSARYASLTAMIEFALRSSDNKFAFCFTSGFNSLYKTESTILNRLKCTKSVLIGFAESDLTCPIICIKDGKFFSSKEFAANLQKACQQSGIQISECVFYKPVTSAERLHSSYAKNVLSFVIPCKKALKADEEVSKTTIQNAVDTLLCIENL